MEWSIQFDLERITRSHWPKSNCKRHSIALCGISTRVGWLESIEQDYNYYDFRFQFAIESWLVGAMVFVVLVLWKSALRNRFITRTRQLAALATHITAVPGD